MRGESFSFVSHFFLGWNINWVQKKLIQKKQLENHHEVPKKKLDYLVKKKVNNIYLFFE